MDIHIESLKTMNPESKEKMLLYALSNFKEVNFIMKGEKVLSDKFSHKERKDLIDMAISELTTMSEIDFTDDKVTLANNDERLYHALGYSIDKANDDLDAGTEEVLNINKKFLDYVKIRTTVKGNDKTNMNISYDKLLNKLEVEKKNIEKADYNVTKKMIKFDPTLQDTNTSKTKNSMVKQVFWTLTIAAILKKVIRSKGYGE